MSTNNELPKIFKEAKALKVFLVLQSLLLVTGIISALIKKGIGNTGSIISFILSLTVILVFGIVFYSWYQQFPPVKEKKFYTKEKRGVSGEISQVQKSIEHCQSTREKINADEIGQINSRNNQNATALASIEQRHQKAAQDRKSVV